MGKSFRFRLWRIIIPGRYPRKSVRSGYTQVVVVGRYGERRFPTCRKSMSSRIRLTPRPAPSDENREKKTALLQYGRSDMLFLTLPCTVSMTILRNKPLNRDHLNQVLPYLFSQVFMLHHTYNILYQSRNVPS